MIISKPLLLYGDQRLTGCWMTVLTMSLNQVMTIVQSSTVLSACAIGLGKSASLLQPEMLEKAQQVHTLRKNMITCRTGC